MATCSPTPARLTSFARGGGCACKLPPGELDDLLGTLNWDGGSDQSDVLVGLGDDAAVVRIDKNRAVICTTDFFGPVVDNARDWGRIAAANALSDVYAMGGEPFVAVNLLTWPRGVLPLELAAEVLAGALEVCHEAGCYLAGGHSIDDPEPKFGMAVTGFAPPDQLLRNDTATVGSPITLTKPLGVGVLNSRHKATGELFPHAVASMVTLNRDASRSALSVGASCATDVTGFGFLGHLFKVLRSSGVSARIDAQAVPYLEGARDALNAGFISGGSKRNLEWVRPHLRGNLDSNELLMLADAQTSGGLLVVGEVPGYPIVGEITRGPTNLITIW